MKILEREAALAVVPRLAATVLILRDSDQGAEVLMVRRSPNASFMPGAYVFPGGAVDAADKDASVDEADLVIDQRIGKVMNLQERTKAFSVAALRECFEECGLWIGAGDVAGLDQLRAQLHAGATIGQVAETGGLPLTTSALHPWSRWVTPLGLPKRFDTVFFVCRAPSGQIPTVDAGETTTLAWVRPEAALLAQAAGNFQMEFATVATVRSLLPMANQSVQAILDHAIAHKEVPTIHPRLRLTEERKIVKSVLPHEAGYAELFGDG